MQNKVIDTSWWGGGGLGGDLLGIYANALAAIGKGFSSLESHNRNKITSFIDFLFFFFTALSYIFNESARAPSLLPPFVL